MPFFCSLRFSALPLFLIPLTLAPAGLPSGHETSAVNPSLLPAGGFHRAGGDTPIKVGGGSMTFHSKSRWRNEGTVTESDCTSIAAAAGYNIVLHDAGDSSTPVSGAWTVTFYNFHLRKPGTPGREGVQMTVNPAHGCLGETGMEAVTITTFHKNPLIRSHVNFYAQGGLPAGGYLSSRRYHNDARHNEYDCSTDRDSCERMAFVSINNAAPMACSTADCMLLVKIPD